MDLTSSSPQGTPTILVVDDEPAIVDSLQTIFERESLRVLTAGSGGEALDIIRRESIWTPVIPITRALRRRVMAAELGLLRVRLQ